MDLMHDQEMSKTERKQKLNELKTNKVKSKPRWEKAPTRNGSFQTRLVSVSSSQKSKEAPERKEENSNHEFSQKIQDIIEQIKNDDNKRQQMAEKEDEGHESDKFSEGGSDSENESDDVPEDELRQLHQQILDSMK